MLARVTSENRLPRQRMSEHTRSSAWRGAKKKNKHGYILCPTHAPVPSAPVAQSLAMALHQGCNGQKMFGAEKGGMVSHSDNATTGHACMIKHQGGSCGGGSGGAIHAKSIIVDIIRDISAIYCYSLRNYYYYYHPHRHLFRKTTALWFS